MGSLAADARQSVGEEPVRGDPHKMAASQPPTLVENDENVTEPELNFTPQPPNEEVRLEALHALRVLDTESEEDFDSLVSLAKSVFGVPIALISLVDANRYALVRGAKNGA